MLNIPVLVRTPQSSSIGPGQYLDGRPLGNTGCCRLFACRFLVIFHHIIIHECFGLYIFTFSFLFQSLPPSPFSAFAWQSEGRKQLAVVGSSYLTDVTSLPRSFMVPFFIQLCFTYRVTVSKWKRAQSFKGAQPVLRHQ